MLGWVSLLTAIVAFGTASLLQATGARRSVRGGSAVQFVLDIATSGPYATGTALDLVAVVLTAVALRSLPLFFVQAATSSSLVVSAIGSALLFPAERRPGLWRPVAAVSLGLALLGGTAAEGASTSLGTLGIALLGCGVPLVFAARLLLQRTAIAPGIGYAGLAGLSYAGMGISLRTLHVPADVWRTPAQPAALIAAGYLALALMYFGRALQNGSVTQAMAIVVSIDTIAPAGVGVWLLGDRTRAGGAVPALAGLLVTVGALLWLLRTTTTTTPKTHRVTTDRVRPSVN
ncbi:MAG: hypothetical protein QOG49_738, partial [Frankiaceae bacterium]|nr:hypothetical protein [Frankiaceae bacterium]